MWKIIGSNLNFVFDNNGYMCNNAVNIMTGNVSQLIQFLGLMNSKLYDWYFKKIVFIEVEGGGIQMFGTVFEKVILKLNYDSSFEINVTKVLESEIKIGDLDKIIYKMLNISDSEIKFIENLYN